MIPVNTSRIEELLTKDWLDKANALTEELKNLSSHEERRALIKRNENLWTQVKDVLLQASHGKCWYSEAREICSDYHIDHFRPKNRAVNLDGGIRPGYWWLAFNWTNFRVAGSICNSPHNDTSGELRGKRDLFPLKDGSSIAGDPSDDLRDEVFYLLDPADPYDPLLLTFDETGLPQPAAEEGSWQFERASVTAKVLFLDYPPMVDERKRIWIECRSLLAEIQRLIGLAPAAISANRNRDLKLAMERLQALVRSEAELAGTARACLLKSGLSWAARVVMES